MAMGLLPLLTLVVTLQQPLAAGTYTLAFPVPDFGPMRYALTVPRGYNPRTARPLVVALHPGGERFPGYGGAFAQQVIAPGLSDLDAIIIAPDCPARGWTDAIAEQAVLALVRSIFNDYNVDRSRVLVAGFSLGGRGAWFFSSRHPDLFTAAIVMAGSTGDEPIDRLARIPTYVIHSRDDEVVPFGPTERSVSELKKLNRTIEFEPLVGLTHYQMGDYVDSLKRGGRWISDRWKVPLRR
jgi:predicted peptidase